MNKYMHTLIRPSSNLEIISRYLNIGFLLLAFIVLVALEIEPAGWILLLISTGLLFLTDEKYTKNIALIHISTAVLGLAPVGTDTSLPFAFYMGIGLFLAVLIPYIFTQYVYRNNFIVFPSLREKAWGKKRATYLLLTLLVSWLLIPLMLRSNSSYLNWALEPGFLDLTVAYLGLNAVGIWDELFFILTLLAILQRFFPFIVANAIQAVFFTSFLYAVGFEGWSFVVIYMFAFAQGYIFKKTKSLLFILAIHLTIDLVLHLSLVYLHFPWLFPYFIT